MPPLAIHNSNVQAYVGHDFRRLRVPGSVVSGPAPAIGQASVVKAKPVVMSFAGDDDRIHIVGDRWSIAGRTRAKDVSADPNDDAFALGFLGNTRSATVCDGMSKFFRGGKFAEVLSTVGVSESLKGNDDVELVAQMAAEVYRAKRTPLLGDWLCEIVMSVFDEDSSITSVQFEAFVQGPLRSLLVDDFVHLPNLQHLILSWKNLLAPRGRDFSYYHARDNLFHLKLKLDEYIVTHLPHQPLFLNEAGTTYVHSITKTDPDTGIVSARDQIVGDSGVAWFKLQRGAFVLVGESRRHSLVQEMLEAGVFQDLAAGFGGSPEDINHRAGLLMRSHPRGGAINGYVNGESGVRFVPSKDLLIQAKRKVEDSGWFGLESGQVFVRILYCDLGANSGPIELLGRDWKEGMSAQEMLEATVAYIDASVTLRKKIRDGLKKRRDQVPNGVFEIPEHKYRGATFPAYWAIPGAAGDDLTVVVEIIQT